MSWALSSAPAIACGQNDELKIRKKRDLENIDPIDYAGGDALIMKSVLAPPMISRDGSYEEHLAVQAVDKLDARTYQIKLRSEKWGASNTQVTADDVAYSLERFKKTSISGRRKKKWNQLKKIEVLDGRTVKIHLNADNDSLIKTHLCGGVGCIVSKSAVKNFSGERFTTEPGDVSGSYNIESNKPGDEIVLKCDNDWTGTDAKYKKVVFKIIRNDKVAEVMISNGAIHVDEASNPSLLRMSPTEVLVRLNPDASSIAVDVVPTQIAVGVMANTASEKLGRLETRRAILQLISPPDLSSADNTITALRLPVFTPDTSFFPALFNLPASQTILTPDFDAGMAVLRGSGITELTLRQPRTLVGQAIAIVLEQQLARAGIKLSRIPRQALFEQPAAVDLAVYGLNAQDNTVQGMLRSLNTFPFFKTLLSGSSSMMANLLSTPLDDSKTQAFAADQIAQTFGKEALAVSFGHMNRIWLRRSMIIPSYDDFGDLSHLGDIRQDG